MSSAHGPHRTGRRTPRATLLALLAAALLGCGRRHEPAPRVEMYLAKAAEYARQSMLAEAVGEAEKAVQTDPDWAPAFTTLGRLLRRAGVESGAGRDDRLGHYQRARTALERAIELAPADPEPRIELAQLHADANRGNDAVALLKPVASDEHPEARFHLASILASLGQLEPARELYRQGIALRPDDARARIGYGVVLERSGDLAGSRAEFERAVALDPGSAEAFSRLGSVLGKLGHNELAILALSRATDLDPLSEDSLYSLAMAQRRAGAPAVADKTEARFAALREARERVSALEESLARTPGDLDVRSELSESYVGRGQTLRAIAAARKVLEQRPGDTRAHRVLAAAYRKIGSATLALSEASLAVNLAPRDAHALELRGVIRFEAGDLDGSEADLASAYALGRRTGTLLEHLSRLSLLRGRPEQALVFSREGVAIEPPHTEVYKLAATGLQQLGRSEEARNVLLMMLVWRPSDIEVLTELARMARAYGDVDRARQYEERLAFVAPPVPAP